VLGTRLLVWVESRGFWKSTYGWFELPLSGIV